MRWTLEPVDGGTLLTLEHTGFEDPWGPNVVEMLSGGWKGMLEKRLPEAVVNMENVASS